jgi:DNA-binding FrmR family transcriptional regulator
MKPSIKRKVGQRLKIAQGQMKGLLRMVEDEKYCVDIIILSSAIKEALSAVEHLILQNHLSTHVIEQIKGAEEEKAIQEILKVCKLFSRKK